MSLKSGDIAPNFKLKDDGGKLRTLSEFKGKKVVVYFYPKDDTRGCTKEACGFRDNYDSFGEKNIVVEVGRLAKQANGSAAIQFEDTLALVAVTSSKEPREDVDFFPLTVNYRERTYAAGKIPGGFFKREGRPREGVPDP